MKIIDTQNNGDSSYITIGSLVWMDLDHFHCKVRIGPYVFSVFAQREEESEEQILQFCTALAIMNL